MNKMVLSMEEPKRKLAKLEEFIPTTHDNLIYEFGRYLAGKLNPELVPMGFILAYAIALQDLQAGKDSDANLSIRGKLVGYPPMMYGILHMYLPIIAKAIFPEEFANAVKNKYDEIRAQMEKNRSEAATT